MIRVSRSVRPSTGWPDPTHRGEPGGSAERHRGGGSLPSPPIPTSMDLSPYEHRSRQQRRDQGARIQGRGRQRRHQASHRNGPSRRSTWRSRLGSRRRRQRPSSRPTARRPRRSSCRATPAAFGGTARAIIVNSGCANACTGEDGMSVALDMAARRRDCSAAPPKKCWSPRPVSSASRCRSKKSAAGFRLAIAALGADQGAAAAARDHDHRSVSERGGRAPGRRRTRS